MPSRITLHGIHCAALSMKTVITGAVARFNGIDNRSFLGSVAEGREINGSGMVTALMTKTLDFVRTLEWEGTIAKKIIVTMEKRVRELEDWSPEDESFMEGL